jgi:tetratricopeptide (TPR) repeat protein
VVQPKKLAAGVLVFGLVLLSRAQSTIYTGQELLWRAAIKRNPAAAMAYNNLGLFLVLQNRADESVYYFERALTLEPRNAEAHANLGSVMRSAGHMDAALDHFRTAAELDPKKAIFQANLGNALAGTGDWRGGISRYETALSLAPDDPNVTRNLVYLLTTTPDASLKDGKRAVALAERAVELSGGQDPAILGTLAAAYAEVERWNDALSAAERARSAADAGKSAAAQKQTRALVEFYRDLASRHEK